MRAANGWRSGSRFKWLLAGLWVAVLTAVLAPVALAQSPGLEPPERPQGLRAEVSHDAVSLSWDDPGDATISGYLILRRDRDLSPVGVFEVLVEDTGSAAAAYADRQVQPETRYNYRVKARNAAGLSRRSNFVRADTPAAPEEAIEEALKKAIEALPEEAVTVWTGQLTVGVFAAAAPPVPGYSVWTRQGALSPDSFWFDKKEYTVLGLLEHGGGLNLVLDRPLPHDFVLELGARRYESGASLEPVFVWAGRYWWPDDAIDWAAGDELTVSIVLDPSTTASGRELAPPSAYLTEAPAAHNGRDPFRVKLVFDESALPLSAALLHDHALQVSGGSVLAVTQGRRDSDWLITLQPDGDAPLTVSLPSPADCADAGAVCSADGRKLRGRLTATIAGPPQLAALRIVGATLSPAFDPASELFTAATALEQVTVEAAADRPSAQLTISPPDADPQQAGHQVALAAAGETTIELELQSLTGEPARVYWVVLRRSAATPEAPSSGLNALRFSGLPALEFSEQESRYELDAPEALEETTVVVSRAESEAEVDVFTVRGDELVVDDADHDAGAPGHQVRLSGWGDTLLLVRVTSGDGRSQRVYATRLRGEPNTPPATPGLRSGTRAATTAKGARDDVPTTLSALSLSGADLTPAFAGNVFEYQASVATDVEQVTITATPTASDGTLRVIPADADALQTGHQVSLGAAGTETVIVVVVSNAAGQLNSYLLTVLRELPATPTTLQSLVVEGHELSPAFAADVPLYSVDVGANVSDVTLTALPAAATATLTFVPADADPATPGYQVALGSPGAQTTTSIAIILSAPGAAAHTTYVVIITRAAPDPSDAALSSLSVNGHTLTPAFDAETYGYALTVPGDQDTISLHAVSRSLSAGLSVSPPDADPLAPGHQIPLAAVEPGQPPSITTVTVTVTSEDLFATQTYTLVVSRSTTPDPAAPVLRLLRLANGVSRNGVILGNISLSPAFAGDVFLYHATVAADIEQVTVIVRRGSNARVLVVPADADPVQSSTQVSLGAAGTQTVITVEVIDAADRLNSYVISVLREPPPPTTLQSLVVEDHELSPVFAGNAFLYSVAADAVVTEVTLTTVATAGTATIEFVPPDADASAPGYQIALGPPGTQTITTISIVVRAPGASADTTYALTITRAAPRPNDTALLSLSIDGRRLTPRFDAETYDYALTVPADQDTLNLHALSLSLSASLSVSPPDADPLEPGYQIPLAAVESGGEPSLTTITLTVTSEDLSATQIYTITVTRSTVPATRGFKFIEVGWTFACAIRIDGTPVCWNYEVPRDADHMYWSYYGYPIVDTQPQGGVVQELTASIARACALRPDGKTRCWGTLGNAVNTPSIGGRDTLTQQSGTGRLIHLYTFGTGVKLLSDGSVVDSMHGRPPGSLAAGPYQAVATAGEFACALDLDGHIKCWASGRALRIPYPDVEFKYLGVGGFTTCGIRADDSTLLCWEWTHNISSYVLHENEPEEEFRMVDAGYGAILCGVTVAGEAHCWAGWNDDSGYDLFWGHTIEKYAANVANLVVAPDLDTHSYTMVAMDRQSFACGLRTDSSIACWGWDNEYLASKLPPLESPWYGSAELIALTVDNAVLLPEFDRDVTAYELSVDNATTAITITPEVTNLFATYAISADTDATVIDDTVDLSLGANVVTITVTAADGVTTRDYTVTVTRAAAN